MSNHDRESSRTPNRDAALDRAWQQASDEQPSPQLDATIIAAARKAVQDRDEQSRDSHAGSRSRSWLTRWQPLAAAAAVAGLAFVLVQSLPRESNVPPSIRMEEPAQVPATAVAQPTTSVPSDADGPTRAESVDRAGAQESVTAPSSQRAKKAVPAPAASQAPAATAATANERENAEAGSSYAVRATDAEKRNAATSKMATGIASAQLAAAPAQESRQVVPAPRRAADPAENIASLYAAGDVTGAAAALRAFRAATPDADTHLPESLREWARTVK